MTRKLVLAALAALALALPALAAKVSDRADRIMSCRANAAGVLHAGMKECRKIYGQNSQSANMSTCIAIVQGNYRADMEACNRIQ